MIRRGKEVVHDSRGYAARGASLRMTGGEVLPQEVPKIDGRECGLATIEQ